MTKSIDEFNEYRADINKRILKSDHLGINRFFALDTWLMKGVRSIQRLKNSSGWWRRSCFDANDCITYHVLQCVEQGVKREEFLDTLNIALVVGGSITIPHLRRAF